MGPRRSVRALARKLFITETEANAPSAQEEAAPSTQEEAAPSSPKKRKRGNRSANKAEGIYVVHALDKDGAPLLPEGVNAKWRNHCGVAVRDKCKIIWPDWKSVPEDRKSEMWNQVRRTIRFPEEGIDRAKKTTMKTLCNIFRDYKSMLNCNFVKKGLVPFEKYGNISKDDWNLFVEQKTSAEAKELSDKMIELNKKNKYKPHLGPGGYRGKVTKWRAKEQELASKGKPNPLQGLPERTKNWIHARSVLTDEGELIVKDSEAEEVIQEIKGPLKEKVEKGEFVPLYHKDILTAGIGTKEHGGRTRGVSSKATFKEGFADTDPGMYKKHDLFKQSMRDEARKVFQECFSSFMQANPRLSIVPTDVQPIMQGSSVASTGEHHPIPDITEQTPCELYMVFSRNAKRRKVATGMALPGRELHNKMIPEDYVRVSVTEMVKGYEKVDLEAAIPEAGIEVLEDAVGTFVMWNRRDVVLLTSTPRASPVSAQGSFQASQPSPLSTNVPTPICEVDKALPPPREVNSPPTPPFNVDTTLPLPQKADKAPAAPSTADNAPAAPSTADKDAVSKGMPPKIPKTITGYDNRKKDVNVEKWLAGVKNWNASATVAKPSSKNPDEAAKIADVEQWRKPMSYDDDILWDMHGDDYDVYAYGKPLLPISQLSNMPWPMRKLHDWYIRAAAEGVNLITAKIPGEVMNCKDLTLGLHFDDFYRIF